MRITALTIARHPARADAPVHVMVVQVPAREAAAPIVLMIAPGNALQDAVLTVPTAVKIAVLDLDACSIARADALIAAEGIATVTVAHSAQVVAIRAAMDVLDRVPVAARAVQDSYFKKYRRKRWTLLFIMQVSQKSADH